MKVDVGIQRPPFFFMSNHWLLFYLRFPHSIYPQKRIFKIQVNLLSSRKPREIARRGEPANQAVAAESLANRHSTSPCKIAQKSPLVYARDFDLQFRCNTNCIRGGVGGQKSLVKMGLWPQRGLFTVVFFLRAAPRKYQLDLEIAKKSNFSKLAQNEALRALVTKILF